MGILLYYMLTNKKPFDGKTRNAILEEIVNGTLKMPNNLPENAQKLLENLLKKEAKDRITLNYVLKHDFLKDHHYHVKSNV